MLSVSLIADQDIRGFDVTVDKALGVGGIEALGALGDDVECSVRFECPFRVQERLQIHPLDVAHGDEPCPSSSPASWIGITFECSIEAARRAWAHASQREHVDAPRPILGQGKNSRPTGSRVEHWRERLKSA